MYKKLSRRVIVFFIFRSFIKKKMYYYEIYYLWGIIFIIYVLW